MYNICMASRAELQLWLVSCLQPLPPPNTAVLYHNLEISNHVTLRVFQPLGCVMNPEANLSNKLSNGQRRPFNTSVVQSITSLLFWLEAPFVSAFRPVPLWSSLNRALSGEIQPPEIPNSLTGNSKCPFNTLSLDVCIIFPPVHFWIIFHPRGKSESS